MRTRLIGLVSLLAVVTAACGASDPGVIATRSRQATGSQLFPTDSTNTDGGEPTPEPVYEIIPNVVDFGDSKTPRDYDGFLTAAFGDIQAFWTETFPATYGAEFEPLGGGIFAGYPSRTAPIPGCGGGNSSYDDVASRGAFYCIDGDFMAYDDEVLLPKLVNELGKEAVAVVLAHEFGHAVQARANEWNQPGVLKEQQADCFAGAWSAHVASGGSDVIRFDDADVRAGLVAMMNVRDPVDGDGLANPQAHGTGFDRVGAFQDGFIGGADRCTTFFTENRTLVDIKFRADGPNPGNLPLVDDTPDPQRGPQDIVTLIPASLEFYWTEITGANGVAFTAPTLQPFATDGPYPSCPGIDGAAFHRNVLFCPTDNTIYWDQDYALELSLQPLTGDMSVGYLYSNAYSEAIQTALNGQRTGEARALFNDCLTGSWARFIAPPVPEARTNKVELSAGDLDEAIVTAIALSDASTDTNVNGSAFEKIGAFRTGVLGGLEVCNNSIA